MDWQKVRELASVVLALALVAVRRLKIGLTVTEVMVIDSISKRRRDNETRLKRQAGRPA
jgi:hypothetical protein